MGADRERCIEAGKVRGQVGCTGGGKFGGQVEVDEQRKLKLG